MLERRLDARAQLRERLGSWPAVDPDVGAFLHTLPAPVRRAVVLAHGEGRGIPTVAAALGVSVRTITGWLAEVYDAYAAQG